MSTEAVADLPPDSDDRISHLLDNIAKPPSSRLRETVIACLKNIKSVPCGSKLLELQPASFTKLIACTIELIEAAMIESDLTFKDTYFSPNIMGESVAKTDIIPVIQWVNCESIQKKVDDGINPFLRSPKKPERIMIEHPPRDYQPGSTMSVQ